MFYRSGLRRRRWVRHQLLLLPRQLVNTAFFVLENLLHLKSPYLSPIPTEDGAFLSVPFNLKADKIDTN